MFYIKIKDKHIKYIKLECDSAFINYNELEGCVSYSSGYIRHYAKFRYMPIGSKEQHSLYNPKTMTNVYSYYYHAWIIEIHYDRHEQWMVLVRIS